MTKRIALLTILSAGAMLAQNSPATDALDALRALKSVTEAGVSYRDYTPRVLDAKIKVDKYLATPEKDDAEFRARIALATRLYVISIDAWRVYNDDTEAQAAATLGLNIEMPDLARVPAIAAHLPEWQKTAAANADADLVKRGVKPESHPDYREELRLTYLGRFAKDVRMYWSAAADTIQLAAAGK